MNQLMIGLLNGQANGQASGWGEWAVASASGASIGSIGVGLYSALAVLVAMLIAVVVLLARLRREKRRPQHRPQHRPYEPGPAWSAVCAQRGIDPGSAEGKLLALSMVQRHLKAGTVIDEDAVVRVGPDAMAAISAALRVIGDAVREAHDSG